MFKTREEYVAFVRDFNVLTQEHIDQAVQIKQLNNDVQDWFNIGCQQALQEQLARAKTVKRIRAYRVKYQTEVTDLRADYDILWNRISEYKEALAEEKMEVWRLRLALKFSAAALTEAAAS